MDNFYRMPITREYETRGCKVKIDAASDDSCVDITVENLKTGDGSKYRYILLPGNDKGYSDKDIFTIQNELNNMLDKYGEIECNDIHFTNQILS